MKIMSCLSHYPKIKVIKFNFIRNGLIVCIFIWFKNLSWFWLRNYSFMYNIVNFIVYSRSEFSYWIWRHHRNRINIHYLMHQKKNYCLHHTNNHNMVVKLMILLSPPWYFKFVFILGQCSQVAQFWWARFQFYFFLPFSFLSSLPFFFLHIYLFISPCFALHCVLLVLWFFSSVIKCHSMPNHHIKFNLTNSCFNESWGTTLYRGELLCHILSCQVIDQANLWTLSGVDFQKYVRRRFWEKFSIEKGIFPF